MKNITALTILNFSHINITEQVLDYLATFLCNNKSLQKLNLSETCLDTKGAVKIAKSIKGITTLTKLNISCNKITELAADDIVAALSCNNKLQVLDLGRNYLKSEGILKIVRGLNNISPLTKLYINHNQVNETTVNNIRAILTYKFKLSVFDVSQHSSNSENH